MTEYFCELMPKPYFDFPIKNQRLEELPTDKLLGDK